MKILVTGGAGFIGSHLVDELIKSNNQVVVVDDLSSGKKRNVHPKANFVKIDIRSKQLERTFKKYKPRIVFHLGAQKSVKKSVADPAVDADINILGSINILEQCKRYHVKKVVFSSTGGAMYGDTRIIPTPEAHPELPVSPYGIAKLSVEKYLYYYQYNFGLSFVSLRYANVYGPRQDPEGEAGVVAIFLDRILQNRQPFINGHGRQTRDYIYVADVIKANILAMKNKINSIYNVGTGVETSVNKLYDIISNISRSKYLKKHGQALPGEQQRSCLSYKKFKRMTGWRPKIKLEEGLEKTYDWFNKQNKA